MNAQNTLISFLTIEVELAESLLETARFTTGNSQNSAVLSATATLGMAKRLLDLVELADDREEVERRIGDAEAAAADLQR